MVAYEGVPNYVDADVIVAKLIQAGRITVDRGLVVGSGGNLSARIPGTELFLITATNTWLDQLVASDFVVMDLDGHTLSSGSSPSSEFRLHLESYRARPDINVCLHLHPQTSVLLSAAVIPIQYLTIDHVYYVRKVVSLPWMKSGSQELAEAAAAALSDCNCVVLEHHGCSVVGESVDLALKRALNLEEAAQLTLTAHQLGVPVVQTPVDYRAFLEANRL